jgi:hypothetical protein
VLSLSRGTVEAVEPGPVERLLVRVGEETRRAIADTALVGTSAVGDEVVVNTAAVDLGLGSGGADIVHVNLSRGLGGAGTEGAHVMKLNYTSLQHAVLPVEEQPVGGAGAGPVAVGFLHGQLPAIAWAFARASGGAHLGYVQTAGGALPGALSDVVRELGDRDLLHGHVAAGPAYGGADGDAITTAGAIEHGFGVLGWDAAVALPGPGILGSGSRLGHGGLVALETAHTARALGCDVVIAPRRSSSDPRERHHGLSHHTRTMLDLALVAFVVAGPAEDDRHHYYEAATDLDGYLASGLPTRNMGREDEAFFTAALASGTVLAGMVVRE